MSKGKQLEKDFSVFMEDELGYNKTLLNKYVKGKKATQNGYEIDVIGIAKKPLNKIARPLGVLIMLGAPCYYFYKINGFNNIPNNLLAQPNNSNKKLAMPEELKVTLTIDTEVVFQYAVIIFIVGLFLFALAFFLKLKNEKYTFVECKDWAKNVPRKEMSFFIDKIKDIKDSQEAKYKPERFYYVAKKGFTQDALSYAEESNIKCYVKKDDSFELVKFH